MIHRPCLRLILCSCSLFALFSVCGLVLLFIWPTLLQTLLDSNMVLTPKSHAFELWKKFPVQFPIDFYFFNWTNPEQVYNATVKPRFVEMGPYRFWETKEKSNITWNENGTVSFRHLKHWYFDEKSALNDIRQQVTTVNPVALSAVYTARTWSYLIRKGLSLSLSTMTSTVHLTRTVSQMLFEGYKDPLINLARSLPFLAGSSLPAWDRFGWFYTRNGSETYEGIFNMGTGINSEFGRLYNWNHLSKTQFFEGSCGQINGSAGEFFPPPEDNDKIRFFSSDLCRTMVLRFDRFTTVHGILGRRYIVDEYMLDNGTTYPENRCFCNGECVPSGLVNVSSCRFGSPSFASLPHFYKADRYYLDNIEGLNPEKDKHEFFITLEPTTGIPLEVSARLQINLLMQPVGGVALFERAPRVFIPMLWFEQKVIIPDNEAFMLRMLLNLPVICISLGIVLIFVSFIVLFCFVYKMCTMNLCEASDKFLYAEQSAPLRGGKKVEIVRKL